MKDRSTRSWRKSTRSAGQEACVEVRGSDGSGTQVRDSKDPDGPKLAFSSGAWRAFHAKMLTARCDLP
ncbi:DUF397 domain-containing protein [Actinomadura oligospora]|uniref:DUF397 domain-containing protein n=1 Tax=Actinomadura oligospora TaxID=111804 RepID=UPI000A016780|nr:DUF397 domain-containing protein [Actinomadura oligospora]